MDHEPQTETADRRRNRRLDSDVAVRMTVPATELRGRAENVSSGGVLFRTDAPLFVTVEIEEGGSRRVRTGRLVRAQRMNGRDVGWAVEFDAGQETR
jgi:hypothetical protein